MKKKFTYIILLFTISIFGQENSEQKVKKTFENYRQAILNDQGEKAISYLSSNTFDYYGTILQETKKADSIRLEELSLIDKIMVLIIRHRTPIDKIHSFDKNSLIVYAFNEGMIGKETVQNYAIGEVSFENENTAEGQLLVQNNPVPASFKFYKENNEWKVDITSVMSGTNTAFEKMIENSGMEENEFIFLILESLTGKEPDKSIWKPII